MIQKLVVVVIATLLCVTMTTDAATPLRDLAKAHNRFSIHIYEKLKTMTDENVFFGPISITTALAIAMMGTSPQAEQEMISAMGLTKFVKNDPNILHETFRELAGKLFKITENCTLLSANGIFAEETHPFIQEFLDDVQTNYDAEIDEVDFKNAFEDVREAINEWVMDNTNDKIKNLIPQGALNAATVMVIVNAIYFKGLWKIPFLPEDTQPTDFYTKPMEKICADMMFKKSDKYSYGESRKFDSKVLKLPYDCQEKDRKLSMYVILPNKRFGITDLENEIVNDYNKFGHLFNGLEEKEVSVWLPKFSFTHEFDLTAILKSLGMNAIFNKGSLTRMSNDTDLEVTSILHKAFVEVNEEGTEAAAATAIVVGVTSIQFPIEFRADHPFLFVIRDDVTKAILFMGRVMEPTECSKDVTTQVPTTPFISTTIPTTTPGGCVPGETIEEGKQVQPDGKVWCYGTYCENGELFAWDNFDCGPTTEPPMTTVPTTEPTTEPKTEPTTKATTEPTMEPTIEPTTESMTTPKVPKTACIENGVIYMNKESVPPRNTCEKKCRKMIQKLVLGVLATLLCVTMTIEAATPLQDLAKAHNRFSLDIYEKLKTMTDENVFFGPISITTALAIAMLGTSHEAEQEMISAMSLTKFVKNDPNILHETFRELAGKLFKITENCTLLSANGIMVIVNAIYFKGLWKIPFLPEDTQPTDFYTKPMEKICADMMFKKSDKYSYGESRKFDSKVLKLPYDCQEKDRKLSMYVILPNKRFGITDLENEIVNDYNKFGHLFNGLEEKEVSVWLPKFSFTYEFELTAILKSLGMNAIFNKGSLTCMSNDTDLQVTSILHKAFVEVNEEGTEAAAATAIIIGVTSIQFPIEFRADHPFLFVIRDDVTKAILFMGRVMQPTECSGGVTTKVPTTPVISTTIPTTPPGGCVPGETIEEGKDIQPDGKVWCYGTYCENGELFAWDNFDCGPTTEPPMTTGPTTEPKTEPTKATTEPTMQPTTEPTTESMTTPKVPKTACIENGVIYMNKESVPPRNTCEKKCRKMIQKLVLGVLATLLCVTMTIEAATPLQDLAKAHNRFSLDIYEKLKTMTDENVFFGPISITTALAIAMLGTSHEAEQEMISAMSLTKFVKNDPNILHETFRELAGKLFKITENCTLLSANGIFAEQTHPFIQKFLDDVQTNYDAEIDEVDFKNAFEDVREAINEWVMDNTNDKIKNLIPQGALDAATVMVIVNAIYFKGLWKIPFLPEDTQPTDFYTKPMEKICADMMFKKSDKYSYGESRKFDSKVLKLPYDCQEKDRKLSMYVILPNKRFGITDLENEIVNDYNKFGHLFNGLEEKEVSVWLPKFSFTYEFELTAILKSLGMNAIFNKGSLTCMSNDTDLQVTSILHKAFVEVNEEGTEAAAATAIIIGVTSIQFPIEFRADHPFLFVIRDDVTKAILFMGRVMQPTECSKDVTTQVPTTLAISTTIPTTTQGGCVPGETIEEGRDIQPDGKVWCYGTYCENGELFAWDNFDCGPTTEPPMTTVPTTEPTTEPKTEPSTKATTEPTMEPTIEPTTESMTTPKVPKTGKMIQKLLLGVLATLLYVTMTTEAATPLQDLAKAHNRFSLDIYEKLRTMTDENVFFGPISITTALAIAMLGTSPKAEKEMISAMRLTAFVGNHPNQLHQTFREFTERLFKTTDNCTLLSANGIFAEQTHPFILQFLDDVQTYYDAEIDEVDFMNAYAEVREVINEWVMNNTNDRIENLIPQGALDAATVMVIVNAIYFKGLWKMPFFPEDTEPTDFYVSSTKTIRVNMMFNRTNEFEYGENEMFDSKVLKLPYDCQEKDRKLSMYVILPNKKFGITDLEDEITNNYNNVDNLLFGLRKQKVKVWLPKFCFTHAFELTKILKSLGMYAIFNTGSLTRMSNDTSLLVTDVIHKAFVEVNEEGTEAAAATAILIKLTAILRPIEFKADHPFLFVIRDDVTKAILFMGRVMQPTECSKDGTTQVPMTPVISTTIPTTPPGGCVPGETLSEGKDIQPDGKVWCYGSYCDDNGEIIHWDDWDCEPTETTTVPSKTTEPTSKLMSAAPVQDLAKAHNQFSLDIYDKLKTMTNKNVFFGPISITTALAIAMLGTSPEAKEEMISAMRLTDFVQNYPNQLHQTFKELTERMFKTTDNCTLLSANGIFVEQTHTFIPQFLDNVQAYYDAKIDEVDFMNKFEVVRRAINAWVMANTNNRIGNLIPQGALDAATVMVIVNAIYFKGLWKMPFFPEDTQPTDFYVSPTKTICVDMMFNRTNEFEYGENEMFDSKVLKLPYGCQEKDCKLSMYVILPNKKFGIADLEAKISKNYNNVDNLLSGLREQKVKVWLPKFSFTHEFELTAILKSLGMNAIFSRGSLTRMSNDTSLLVTDVIHKAFVEVNEEGMEAAAATAILIKLTAILRPIEFRADHPFLFVIRDDITKTILFMGRVMQPTECSKDVTTQVPTTPVISTTIPTTPPGGCVPGETLSEGKQVQPDGKVWCYGSYCDDNGEIIHWDDWDCEPTETTTVPPKTTEPTSNLMSGILF
ncbi:unnamed protein product [Owenia fusiformis]|uniref:Serpin domain-containing protein n=1 Tax=Owenia fusiformis TaxID=6347 RepID=A0A8S4NFZ9_OWEFU|nr:unnamed protein product [Owenia fusiformis]